MCHGEVPYLPCRPTDTFGVGGVRRLGLCSEVDRAVAGAELTAEVHSLRVRALSSRTPHNQGLGYPLLTQQVVGWDPRRGVKGMEDWAFLPAERAELGDATERHCPMGGHRLSRFLKGYQISEGRTEAHSNEQWRLLFLWSENITSIIKTDMHEEKSGDVTETSLTLVYYCHPLLQSSHSWISYPLVPGQQRNDVRIKWNFWL